MGRAARWLKGLFGLKKDKEQKDNSYSGDRKDKNQWSFGHSRRDSGGLFHNATIPPNITPAEAAWLRSFHDEAEEEQNKHAIAVVAATAAAADAAVAAAQAAAAVFRLTSHGRGTMFCGGLERWAAVKIQTVFRGYLARRALKALKGLVKMQALVRGYLVRKQATATLRVMQALTRAQATVPAQKSLRFNNNGVNLHPHFRTRKSIERFDDSRSQYIKKIQSRRLLAPFETTTSSTDESPKIVEIDTGRPKSRSWRINTLLSDSGEDPFGQTLSSPQSCRVPARLSLPSCRNFPDADWVLKCNECRYSVSNGPVTPETRDSILRQYTGFPNYMGNTKSSKAKLRSQSAPKQRVELGGSKRRLSLNEMTVSRNSPSWVRMKEPSSPVQETISLKNAVMGKLDSSSKIIREPKRDYYVQRRW